MSVSGDGRYVEQKAVIWLVAGFIKGVGVRFSFVLPTLVWILIGLPTGKGCIDCCVFFLWRPSNGCVCVAVCCLFVHLCVYLHGCCRSLQAGIIFAAWKASQELSPITCSLKCPLYNNTISSVYEPCLWLRFLDYLHSMTSKLRALPLVWTSSSKRNQLYFCLVLIGNVI